MPVQEVSRDALDQGQLLQVLTAFEKGDFTVRMPVELTGVAGKIADTLNEILERQRELVKEFEQVSIAVGKEGHVSQRASLQGARGVGTDGKLGGQAVVPGVAGTWKDLTDNVNSMASNLTGQVRNIADVTIAVANGDLSKKITVDVRGEILQLKDTINTMVDQLNAFAAEVTRVAREVGTEGNLGGQAVVPGVAGTWKDLTESVNPLAENLRTQLRAMAEVATAGPKGDLTGAFKWQA